MDKLFTTIWFPYLKTDWHTINKKLDNSEPIIVFAKKQNRNIVTEINATAEKLGLKNNMVLADAKAAIPHVITIEDDELFFKEILEKMAVWLIRYSPIVAVLTSNDIVIDCTGCPHLWKGNQNYINHIQQRFTAIGYTTHIALSPAIGACWAFTHYTSNNTVVEKMSHIKYHIELLPVQALRLSPIIRDKLIHLGLKTIDHLLQIPTAALKRRFGNELILQLQYILGYTNEPITPIITPPQYTAQIYAIDPITTRNGIELALQQILTQLCNALQKDGQGLTTVFFKCFRIDGKEQEITITINEPTVDIIYLEKLFALKIQNIAPGLGIELFTLTAIHFSELKTTQQALWLTNNNGVTNKALSSFIDTVKNKIGQSVIKRYLPAPHYWPERSFTLEKDLEKQPDCAWNTFAARPIVLYKNPLPIIVTAPIPDYPPMNFRLQNKLYKIVKADGPERIEQEWWITDGQHRDYYAVETNAGYRYWLFRLGHYNPVENNQWFLHGVF